jgi:hypothetical protein
VAQQDSKSGHVKLVERKRGPKFYAKFRSNGHQTTRLMGRAWLKRGRPPEAWFTRQMAEVELRRIMDGQIACTLAIRSRSVTPAPSGSAGGPRRPAGS